MKKKAVISLALTIIISMQFMNIATAFAGETTSQTSPVNNDGSITLIESYPAADDAPIFPRVITQDGQKFLLDEISVVRDPNYERPKQHFTKTLFSQVPLEGINNLGSFFPATIAIDDGDYQGEIGLDPEAPFTVVNRYEAFRVQVDRAQVFSGLPDNDVTRLPTFLSFEVSSSASPGATEVKELQILDVSYSITGTDYLGLPDNYTASVTYRGQEEYLELVYYDVTANYSGELESSAEQMMAIGTYGHGEKEIAENEVPLAEPLSEPEVPLFPLVITGAIVVILIAAPLLYLLFLKNARFIRVIDEKVITAGDQQNNEHKVTTELICRRRLVLKEGVAEFRIPPDVDILSGDSYYLVIKPRLADREGEVMLTWQGRIMAVLPLARHIDINFKELLITSVEAIFMETDLLD